MNQSVRMARLKLVVVTVILGALGATGTAAADPGLSNVTPHRHYIQTEDGIVQVGPRVCDNPNLQHAFNEFHANIHSHNGVTGEIGPLAPGLHDGVGGEITSGPC
jgi:hypothetical protein